MLARPLPEWMALGFVFSVAASIFACSAQDAPKGGPGGRDAGIADGGGAADARGAATAEGLFRALEGDLVVTCGGGGGGCHVNGTVGGAGKWLAPPDAYRSAKAWRGIVPDDRILEHSILLTQIEHTGPSLTASASLYARVTGWIVAEIAGTRLPGSEPFPVQVGANTVDLGKVIPGADGAKLRFDAQIAGDILTLTQLRIASPTQSGLRVESPFFAILPASGPVISDTTNGFTGTMEIPAGETKDLFGGTLVVPRWKPTTRLQLFFNQIGLSVSPDAGAPGLCKSVATFTSSAVPAFKLALPNGIPCLGCHGGANDVATNAMDLSKVDTDDAAACAQARGHVDLVNKAKSALVVTPTGRSGGNPNHAERDAGVDYVNGILGWINNE